MAARGYWQAFQQVKASIQKILSGENAGQVADEDHGSWYRQLFEPSVIAGILKPEDLGKFKFDPLDATNIAPLVVWLGSEASNGISGRVFGMRGGRITVAEGWHAGPRAEKQGRWEMTELDATIPELVRQAAANADTAGEIPKSVA